MQIGQWPSLGDAKRLVSAEGKGALAKIERSEKSESDFRYSSTAHRRLSDGREQKVWRAVVLQMLYIVAEGQGREEVISAIEKMPRKSVLHRK